MPRGVKGSKSPHGSPWRYKNHDCRCVACRKANRDWVREYTHRTGRRRPREQYLAALRANLTHGAAGYRRGCRCDVCRTDASARRSEARRVRTPVCHRSASSYKNGCRCDDCREAINLYHITRRQRVRAAA